MKKIAAVVIGGCASIAALAVPLSGKALTTQTVGNVTVVCNTNGDAAEYLPTFSSGVGVPGQTYTFGPYTTQPIVVGPTTVVPAESFGPFTESTPPENVNESSAYGQVELVAAAACAGLPSQVGQTLPAITGQVGNEIYAQANCGAGLGYFPTGTNFQSNMEPPASLATDAVSGASTAGVGLPASGGNLYVSCPSGWTYVISDGNYLDIAYSNVQVNGVAPAVNGCAPDSTKFDCDARQFTVI